MPKLKLRSEMGLLNTLQKRCPNGVDDGWWLGELHGKIGLFPSIVVEEVSGSSEGESPTEASSMASPPSFGPPSMSAPSGLPPPPPPLSQNTDASEPPARPTPADPPARPTPAAPPARPTAAPPDRPTPAAPARPPAAVPPPIPQQPAEAETTAEPPQPAETKAATVTKPSSVPSVQVRLSRGQMTRATRSVQPVKFMIRV